MNAKETPEQIFAWIESEEGKTFTSLPLTVRADVVVTCMLQAGAKSYSHVVQTLETYKELCTRVSPSEIDLTF